MWYSKHLSHSEFNNSYIYTHNYIYPHIYTKNLNLILFGKLLMFLNA